MKANVWVFCLLLCCCVMLCDVRQLRVICHWEETCGWERLSLGRNKWLPRERIENLWTLPSNFLAVPCCCTGGTWGGERDILWSLIPADETDRLTAYETDRLTAAAAAWGRCQGIRNWCWRQQQLPGRGRYFDCLTCEIDRLTRCTHARRERDLEISSSGWWDRQVCCMRPCLMPFYPQYLNPIPIIFCQGKIASIWWDRRRLSDSRMIFLSSFSTDWSYAWCLVYLQCVPFLLNHCNVCSSEWR